MIAKILLSIVLIILSSALWKIIPLIYRSFTTPLRQMPGPPNASLLLGNFSEMVDAENSVLEEKWVAEHGHSIIFPSLFSVPVLLTTDTRALLHVLTHTNEFPKSKEARHFLGRLVGPGVLVAEGEQHKRQRRVMNPAFGPAQTRELTGIFFEKSLLLRDAWVNEISKTGQPTRLDVLSWLGRATLDIIGLAGFNYEFNAIDGASNELHEAFGAVFEAINPDIFAVIQILVPLLQYLPTKRRTRAAQSQATMKRIGRQLIADKKAAILAQSNSDKQGPERKDMRDRDLLSLLIKANMAVDIAEDQQLTDDEVLAQVPTFIVAGHETTSTATMWCLFALTQAPDVQRKLREELLTVKSDSPTMDELVALPYLDMVVKEALRIHSPVPMTDRIAADDCVIPVGEPFIDRKGKLQTGIRIAKGDTVIAPLLMLNRSKALWGEDAMEFKPERWENLPEAISSIPGVWSNLFTFYGGPHACIGYRFAIVEMKALLFTLVRAFEFELAVPVSDVTKKTSIVQRPLIISEKEKGNQMPLIIKQYQRY